MTNKIKFLICVAAYTVSFAIIIYFTIGCNGGGGSSNDVPRGTPIKSVVADTGLRAFPECRHMALVAAMVYEEAGYMTRIMYGYSESLGWHVQAQVLIDGQWQWLEVRTIYVKVGAQEDFEPTKEYHPDEIYMNIMSGIWY